MLTGVTPQWLRGMFGRIAQRYDLTNTIISAGLDHAWRRLRQLPGPDAVLTAGSARGLEAGCDERTERALRNALDVLYGEGATRLRDAWRYRRDLMHLVKRAK